MHTHTHTHTHTDTDTHTHTHTHTHGYLCAEAVCPVASLDITAIQIH